MQINLDEYEVIEAIKEYAAKKVNLAMTQDCEGISIELGEGEE